MDKPVPICNLDSLENQPPEPTSIIPEMLYQQVLSVIWGPPESGKSHIAIDLGCTLSQHMPIVYVAAEVPYEVKARNSAWKMKYGLDCKNQFHMWKEPVLLMQSKSVNYFASSISALKPRVIFIDPLAQCFVGGDENSTKDMEIVTYHLSSLARHLNAAICVVAHTGWDHTRERGSSVLRGAYRLGFSVEREEAGIIHLQTGKKNFGSLRVNRFFRTEQIGENGMHTVLIPAIGDPYSSVGDLPERQKQALTCLAMPIHAGGITRTELGHYMMEEYGLQSITASVKAANALIKRELVDLKAGGKVTLSDKGEDLAAYYESVISGVLGVEKTPSLSFNWSVNVTPSSSPTLHSQNTTQNTIQNSPIHPIPPSTEGEGSELECSDVDEIEIVH